MKFNLKLMSLSLAAVAMTTACSDDMMTNGGDQPSNGNGYNSGKKVYITTGLALPTGTFGRSATDWTGDPEQDKDKGDSNSNATPDTEVGHEYENEVNNVILIFTDNDNRFITHSVIPRVDQAPVKGEKFDFTITAEVSFDDLEQAYDKGYLGGTSDKQIVHIFAFCNYTSRMFERFKELAATQMDDANRLKWIDWEGIVEETPSPAWETPTSVNTIWSKNSFTMTNASIKDYKFPETITYWEEFTDQNNPYKVNTTGDQTEESELTPITVERVAARIDFKDGSPKDNTYPIKVYTKLPSGEDKDGETVNYYNVKLTRMSLVNMNQKYYYLRRVSSDGTPTGAVVGGMETTKNWVVDYNWEPKKTVQGIKPSNARNYFNFPLYTTDDVNIDYDRAMWYSDDIVNILNDSKHDKDTWGTQGNYHIWRYVTENTIPTVDQQKTIQSTGIVFKGSIIPGADIDKIQSTTVQTALNKAAENNQGERPTELVNLYDYQNVLYGSVAEIVRDGVEKGPNSPLYNKVYRILRHWKLDDAGKVFKYDAQETNGVSVEVVDMILNPEHYQDMESDLSESLAKSWEEVKKNKYTIDFSTSEQGKVYSDDKDGQFMALCASNDITVFIPSNEQDTDGWGYYCYYFYWNRHNDNNKSGLMGQMEFATVRNNVYKLSVTTINRFGHPRSTDFDPDPVDPEDPDEDPTAYIQIKVDVLPWVVRENKITF